MYCVVRDAQEIIETGRTEFFKVNSVLKALIQEGSDLIAIIDAEANYSYVSPTSTAVLGMAPEAFIGRNAFEFIHPDDVELTLASLKNVLHENRVAIPPFRFQNQNKEWRWIETVLTNMFR